jgi:hypothetical protein
MGITDREGRKAVSQAYREGTEESSKEMPPKGKE